MGDKKRVSNVSKRLAEMLASATLPCVVSAPLPSQRSFGRVQPPCNITVSTTIM